MKVAIDIELLKDQSNIENRIEKNWLYALNLRNWNHLTQNKNHKLSERENSLEVKNLRI